ncbi:hypothetical protein JK361_22170 [Streptomyces sp. 5-8]|uniref:Uncharacterized protein n=1 Tax=Streptomyces musisoli TaxID=2802280 RepID=A0ABS1P4H7_9ACTN|nr:MULTISPECIES: hypothetical protein [Streptomyces]MBL1107277.1 hypothetical protein [Streptomyces musisoli]MBY8845615.1 hypothetical protein [Streptomyces sp. SP2-10]
MLSALIAAVSAFYGVRASVSIADTQRQDAARSAISDYVVKMSELVRTSKSDPRNEIVILASQVDALIAQYGQDKLHVSASTYRLTGLFLTLSTTDLELAERMGRKALELSARMEPDGAGGLRMVDPLEALQAHRVLADVAAQNLDLHRMNSEYQAALDIIGSEGKRNRYIRKEAPHYTRAYWALSAMQLADGVDKPDAALCDEVRRRAVAARADLQALGRQPEIVRRAGRVHTDRCSTGVPLKDLQTY